MYPGLGQVVLVQVYKFYEPATSSPFAAVPTRLSPLPPCQMEYHTFLRKCGKTKALQPRCKALQLGTK